MNDPYMKLFESINKVLTKLAKMIDWIAKRTLSAQDYLKFVDEFAENDGELPK